MKQENNENNYSDSLYQHNDKQLSPDNLVNLANVATDGMPSEPDNFLVKTNIIDSEAIIGVMLPKFNFNVKSGIEEQSLVTIIVDTKNYPKAYSEICASVKGLELFQIDVLDAYDSIVSVWDFSQPKIHAVDFGFLFKEKKEPTAASVQVSYSNLKVDGISV